MRQGILEGKRLLDEVLSEITISLAKVLKRIQVNNDSLSDVFSGFIDSIAATSGTKFFAICCELAVLWRDLIRYGDIVCGFPHSEATSPPVRRQYIAALIIVQHCALP